MTTPGLRVDQVAPAILAVPGVTLEMLNVMPTEARSTSIGTFSGVGSPEPGDIIGTFVVPVAGLYLLDLVNINAYGSGNYGYFRVVFDYDTTPIYVGGGDDWRMTHYGSDVRQYNFVGTVNLAAGTHKVKVEWKVAGGTMYWSNAQGCKCLLQGTLVSGSGAGGIIKTEATDSVDRSGTGASVTEITQLALTVTTTANETVLLNFVGQLVNDGSTNGPAVYYKVDSGSWYLMALESSAPFPWALNLDWSYPITISTAGEHTIRLGVKIYENTAWILKGTIITSRYSCLQFRGGLVPIQKEGTSVVDTPRAINFKGPVTVTLTSGVADVQILGNIQDLTSAVPFMTSNTTPSGVASASSEYSACPAWKAFDANVSGWITNGGGAPGWLQYQFTAAKIILSYSIIGWSVDTWPARFITAWTLRGSNNGSDFTVLDTRTKLWRIGWVPWQPQLFVVTTPGSYIYYRLNITANYGGDVYVGVNHLALYEF